MRVNTLYKILLTGYSFSMFSEASILPIYAVFVQGIGGDILDASDAMAVFLITQGVFTIITHRMAWINRRRIPTMVAGWLIWVFGISLYLIVSSVLTLFITQIFIAIGNAIADPIFDEELANHTDKKNQEFEWGFFEGSQAIVQGVAALVGGLVVALFSFKVLIYVMVTAATVSLFLILLYYLKVKKQSEHNATPLDLV